MSIHSIRFGAEVKLYFPIIAKIMSLSGAEKLIPQPNMALLFMAEWFSSGKTLAGKLLFPSASLCCVYKHDRGNHGNKAYSISSLVWRNVSRVSL